jgi:transposase
VLSWPSRVFVLSAPTDMRKGFPGLSALVRERLGHNPQSGDLFVFANRRGDRLKCLYWDRNGYVIVYKQLGRGTFRLPRGDADAPVEMTTAELAMLLDGADLRKVARAPRPAPPKRLHYDAKAMRFAVDAATVA